MSSSHFSRTSRNTPQRNLGKTQEISQTSTNPSQLSSTITQQPPQSGYVYRPPTKIARTNVSSISPVQAKQQVKKQQKPIQTPIQQPQKVISFIKKPAVQSLNITTTQKVQQVKQVKPVVKPASRLNYNKSDFFQAINPVLPKKQQLVAKPTVSTIYPKKNEIKPVVEENNNKMNQQPNSINLNNHTKSLSVLDIKKPSLYSYPKKISRRGPENEGQKQTQPLVPKQQEKQQVTLNRNQTPKFNRIQQEQSIKHQVKNVPSYSYQRKNLTQNSATQSTSSIKPILTQTTILKTEEKGQSNVPIKPASTIIDSPKKSPLTHASKYGSKFQTPIKIEPQQKQQKQQEIKKPIKRSNILMFALHHLFSQKIQNSFKMIDNFSNNYKQTKQNQKHHLYFDRSLRKFCKKYENEVLLRNSFKLIKNIYSKILKTEITKSIDPKISSQLKASKNQCFGKVLQNIIFSEQKIVKISFNHLKMLYNVKKSSYTSSLNGVKLLVNIQSKKLKEHLNSIIQFSNQRNNYKLWTLNRYSYIGNSFKKNLLQESFIKISLFKLKQLVSAKPAIQIHKTPSRAAINLASQNFPSQVVKSQQQSQNNLQIKQKVQQLETKLQQLKQKFSQQPSQSDLRTTSKELKQQKEKISLDIKNKKLFNSELKQRLQDLNRKKLSGSGQLGSLSDMNKGDFNQQSTLSLIHQIYMKCYKQSEDQCVSQQNIQSLCSIHRVQENCQSRQIVSKWLAIKENLQLKHEINLYQGNYSEQASSAATSTNTRKQLYKHLKQQNEIVVKFIRSYIKQRYMWEQVKEYVAAVINE